MGYAGGIVSRGKAKQRPIGVLALRAFLCLTILAALVFADSFANLSAQASSAREANDIPRAVTLYRQALNLNPKWQEGWWFLGTLLYDTDQYAAAREALKHLVDLDSSAAPAWGLLGLCEFETGNYAQSLADIRRNLASPDANQPQMEQVLRYHECLLLTHTGEFDKALEKYAWFAKKQVRNPELLSAVGLAALRAPLLPKDIPSNRQELYLSAGKAAYLIMMGDYTEAEQGLQDLIERFPTTHYVHYVYGMFLLRIKPDAAIDELRQELGINPSSAAANAMLAWALLDRDDVTAALPYAEKAAQLQPEFEVAQYVLGRSLAERGKLEQGIAHLALAEKDEPPDLGPHVSLATAYSRAGRPQEARRERQLAIGIAKGVTPVANP